MTILSVRELQSLRFPDIFVLRFFIILHRKIISTKQYEETTDAMYGLTL